MEELNKHQIVLVTLLVSFITSVATGIVTATLVEQAPQSVSQTINHVIERTVEKIVPGTTAAVSNSQQESVVRVVKEEDLIVSAVERNAKSLVRIKGTTSADSPVFLGLGLVVSKELVVADKSIIKEGGSYIAIMPDGKVVDLDIIARNETTKIAVFRARLDPQEKYRLVPATLGNSDNIKIGQNVIVLAGMERNIISRSTVTGLITNSDGTPSNIETDSLLNFSAEPLINLDGEVVGIKTQREGVNPADFLPVNILKANLAELSTPKAQ